MTPSSCRGCGFGRVLLWSALRTVMIIPLSLTTGTQCFVFVLVTVELLVTPAIYRTNMEYDLGIFFVFVRLSLSQKSNF